MLGLVSRGRWEDTAGVKGFSPDSSALFLFLLGREQQVAIILLHVVACHHQHPSEPG